ncbi:hypothetical protein VE03_02708 [Pseudogymnoascus sp. 23342-1-I1]|nr:hypothetical protein VE03_02708 [Pseudogymnoascus sp. 23342-1-I1]
MRPLPPQPPPRRPLLLLALLAFLPLTTATFTLSHPLPFGSHSTSQSQPPCGASPLLLEATTGFYVGGDAVAVVSAGVGASILIRATVGELGAATNWTDLFPVVRQEGGGKFCEPLVPAPEEWAGREGVVQVVESGEEGLSYQCAPVIFRATRGGSITTLCSNSTDVTGSFTTDPRLPSDGTAIQMSTAINLSASTDTASGLAPGETAPETGGGGGGGRARAEKGVLVGVLGAGVVVAAALLS